MHTQGGDFSLKQRSFLGFARECKLTDNVRDLCGGVGVGEYVRMCVCGSGSVCMCAVWDCVCGRVGGCVCE